MVNEGRKNNRGFNGFLFPIFTNKQSVDFYDSLSTNKEASFK